MILQHLATLNTSARQLGPAN